MKQIKAVRNYFLSGFKDAGHFERRKARYLFYILMSALFFMSVTTVSQLCLRLGAVYLTANIVSLTGLCLSLIFFKQKRLNASGHLMAAALMLTIAIEAIVLDANNTNPEIRYRLYINFASLLGLYFIILSFFREKKYVIRYAIAFELVLFAHTCVIYNQVKNIPHMGAFTIEHFCAITIGLGIIAAICTSLLSYIDALFQQNMEYAERFKTHNEQLEKMVAERTHALQSTNKNLQEFAYIVSHDLKEPLRTISGFVTLIKKELDRLGLNENEIADYVNFVTSGTQHMDKLIHDILTYSKLNEAGKNFEPVDMEELVRMVKSRYAKTIYESEAEFYITRTMPVNGNVVMLNQLFDNLISNAIKYRSPKRNLKVTITSTRNGNRICYFVKDNGIGIPKEHFENIFRAFRRLHSKVEYEGTGVGLAICKKIVELHGGAIGVESIEGEGSSFWFTLPGAQTEVPASQPVVHAA